MKKCDLGSKVSPIEKFDFLSPIPLKQMSYFWSVMDRTSPWCHESCLQSFYWQSHPGRGTEITEHCDPSVWSVHPLLLCSTELPHSKLTQKGGSAPWGKHTLSDMRGLLQTAFCNLVITLRYQDCWNTHSSTCWGSFFLSVPVKHWSERSSLW